MYRPLKRILDVVISLTSIILLLPLFLFMTIIIKTTIPGSVLFKQKRVGQYNTIFTLYKFRSMKEVYDEGGNIEKDEKRLTKFGIFIRRTSLDELPQLFNILLGHMSFVGPRPKQISETLLMKDTRLVFRTAIKPGLTSWSIVNGRSKLRPDIALEYDLEHVEKDSLWFDIKIFFNTFKIVINGSGVTTEGYATFQPIGEFLILNKIKATDEVKTINKEAETINKENLKYLSMNITKKDFIAKRRELQKTRAKHDYNQPITWN